MSESHATERTTLHFEVQAECLDEKKEVVIRRIGLVRGMTDSGQPGWTRFGSTTFATLEEAQSVARKPELYSVYDGHYRGGKVVVVEVEVVTVVTRTTQIHPVDAHGT